MKIDIMGSIIITLMIILAAHLFHLDSLEGIVLMLMVFLIINYFHVLSNIWYNIKHLFKKKVKVEIKSGYDRMKVEEVEEDTH